jgi:HSP20 family protein
MVSNPFNQLAAEFFNGIDDSFTPRVDISETEQHFELHISLPGMKKSDLKIEIKEHILTISGERKEVTEDDKKWHRREMRYGKFSRSFRLGETADEGQIEAAFEDGILKVSIAKKVSEKATATVIEVK